MGSYKEMEPFWWETKPKKLNEWVYEWRKAQYHKNPRVVYRKDYDLAKIEALQQALKEKLYWQRHLKESKTRV